jgi:hypothetical protein
MRANPAGNCAFSGRPRTFVLLNGSVAHKGLFHAGKLRSNPILRSLIVCRHAGWPPEVQQRQSLARGLANTAALDLSGIITAVLPVARPEIKGPSACPA